MVGNGGPLQATLTTKELREMARIPHCQAQINLLDLARVKGLIEGKCWLVYSDYSCSASYSYLIPSAIAMHMLQDYQEPRKG